jgi:hypothetical protein
VAQNRHLLVQRLVQKEKQVLQLERELYGTKKQNNQDVAGADEKKKERERTRLNSMLDEITKLKARVRRVSR